MLLQQLYVPAHSALSYMKLLRGVHEASMPGRGLEGPEGVQGWQAHLVFSLAQFS